MTPPLSHHPKSLHMTPSLSIPCSATLSPPPLHPLHPLTHITSAPPQHPPCSQQHNVSYNRTISCSPATKLSNTQQHPCYLHGQPRDVPPPVAPTGPNTSCRHTWRTAITDQPSHQKLLGLSMRRHLKKSQLAFARQFHGPTSNPTHHRLSKSLPWQPSPIKPDSSD